MTDGSCLMTHRIQSWPVVEVVSKAGWKLESSESKRFSSTSLTSSPVSQSESATRATNRKNGKDDVSIISKSERSKIGI